MATTVLDRDSPSHINLWHKFIIEPFDFSNLYDYDIEMGHQLHEIGPKVWSSSLDIFRATFIIHIYRTY